MIKTSAKLAMYLMGRNFATDQKLSPTEEELINETEAMEQALRELGGLLKRIGEWDMLDVTGDGPYWKQEIDSVSDQTKEILEGLK